MKKKTETSSGIIPLKLNGNNWEIFLVQHFDGNHWGFPKGKVEADESLKDTALRELKEETNLDPVKFISDKPFIERYHFYRNHLEIEKKVYYYLVQVKGEIKLQEHEVLNGAWFSFKDAYSHITFDESKFIFTKVQDLMREIHT
jgi:bis(5'-nucleosidyl)-tetraphosphatase